MKNLEQSEADRIIRNAGFRATTPRRHLFSLLFKEREPLTIQEMAKKLALRNIDQVTVYRMVDAFKKAGMIREVNLRGEHPRYELEDEHDHHHIVCTSCEKVEDFTDLVHESIGKRVLAKSKSFKQITGHSFDLYGLCKTCAN